MSDDNADYNTETGGDEDNAGETNNNKKGAMSTTAPAKKKDGKKDGKKDATVAKVSQEEIQKSINRKKWVDRIAMVLLASALAVYFIVLIISMVASSNSTVVEKDDVEKLLQVPAMYIEVDGDSESTTYTCTIEVYVNDSKKLAGTLVGSIYTATTTVEGWEVTQLSNFSGIMVEPPELELKPERTIKNHIDVECSTSNVSIFVNLYYPGQYDQYSDDEYDLIEAIAYDALDSKMGYETDYDLEWYTVSDELEFAARPEDLDGIEGAYDYYEMALSGVYPLSIPESKGRDENSRTGFSFYRKHTNYVYQDSTTFADVVAAIGGMYTSLASILAWFLVKFLWGYEFKIYTWQLYKWVGFAPHAPKDKKEEGEGEDGGEEDV